jgi:hypothetical protein
MRVIKFVAWRTLLFLAVSPIYGKGFGKNLYVCVFLPYTALGGSDFDGAHYFNTGSELIFVPKIASKLGWGVAIGPIYSDTWDYEFYYARSSFNSTFFDVASKAYMDAVGVNSRFYIFKKGWVRPYVNVSLDISFLRVVNGSRLTDQRTSEPYAQGDSHFTGVGVMAGLGVGIIPTKSVLVFVGTDVRWNLFTKVKGLSGEAYSVKDLSSLGISFRSGLCYRFSL